MSNAAISVESLSKRYRIGVEEERPDTLAKTILRTAGSPIRNLQRLRSLSTFGGADDQSRNLIWALRNVSFEVEQGEIVGVIGPNGAGKSTLLKILSRITPPTGGRVALYGRVSSLLEVGTGFHQELTGRENVYLNGTILGMSRKEVDGKFDEIVDFAGVEKFMDTPVKRYSSGMKMRLAFSVAAHLEPEILLIDEVLAVGDAEFQQKCLGRMEEVAGEGRTILFVSHNMSAINRLCPRSILLDGGTVTEDGNSAQVTSNYFARGGVKAGSRVWPLDQAPGGSDVQITSLSLKDRSGDSLSVVNVREPLELEIGYYVHQPGLSFRCQAIFFTQGVTAFASVEPMETIRDVPGYYVSTVSIPGDLLAQGEYVVGASFSTSHGTKTILVRVTNGLSFQVYDRIDGQSAVGDYAQNLNGVVRPKLNWNVKYAGESSRSTEGSSLVEV